MNKMSWERSHGVTKVWLQQEMGRAFWETPLEWEVINSQRGMAVRCLFIAILIEFERKIEIQSSAKLREDSERAQSIRNAWKEKAATPPTKTKCSCPHLTCPLQKQPDPSCWTERIETAWEGRTPMDSGEMTWLGLAENIDAVCQNRTQSHGQKHGPFGWAWNRRSAGDFCSLLSACHCMGMKGTTSKHLSRLILTKAGAALIPCLCLGFSIKHCLSSTLS